MNMKEITIYECVDGTRFDKKEDAMNYDVLLLKCSEVENSIGKKRELEYDQFIQRNAEAVKSAWIKFCDIVADAIPDWAKWAKECGAGTRHRTHIGRIISDYNIRCLCSLYFRFDCIDDNGREYQQPYFANGHQNEATKEVKI